MILEWGLGAGESAVIAHAHANTGMAVIIDDLMGRKCARVLGIPVRGTLGIVLQAKQDGHIPNARRIIEELISGGMYLSRSVMDEALKRVNE
jgi:predicted nucleic acid-binding protein